MHLELLYHHIITASNVSIVQVLAEIISWIGVGEFIGFMAGVNCMSLLNILKGDQEHYSQNYNYNDNIMH